MNKDTQKTIRFDNYLLKRIEKEAKKARLRVPEFVRRACEEKLNKENEK